MSAPELHARLDAAGALLAEYRQTVSDLAGGEISPPAVGDRPSPAVRAQRLADSLESVAGGLWSALSELESADVVLTAQEATGLITTVAVSVSVDYTPVVVAALADATVYRSGLGDGAGPAAYQDLARRLRDNPV
jgi:hypothetical protein